MNIKSTALRLAAVVAVAFTAIVAIDASPASAAAPFFSCVSGGIRGECTTLSAKETLWEADNTVNRFLAAGASVEVQCWYGASEGGPFGNSTPKDGVWDHVVWVFGGNFTNPALVQGHLADDHVNFGGKTPAQIGLPHC